MAYGRQMPSKQAAKRKPEFGTAAEEMISGDPALGVKFEPPRFSNPIKQIGGLIKKAMAYNPHKKKKR